MHSTRARRPRIAGPAVEFAVLIYTKRRDKGLTQCDLAAESGVSRATVLRWEAGFATAPEPRGLRCVCAVLDIDVCDALAALGYLAPADYARAA